MLTVKARILEEVYHKMLLIPDFGELRIFIFKGYLRGWIAYYRFVQNVFVLKPMNG